MDQTANSTNTIFTACLEANNFGEVMLKINTTPTPQFVYRLIWRRWYDPEYSFVIKPKQPSLWELCCGQNYSHKLVGTETTNLFLEKMNELKYPDMVQAAWDLLCFNIPFYTNFASGILDYDFVPKEILTEWVDLTTKLLAKKVKESSLFTTISDLNFDRVFSLVKHFQVNNNPGLMDLNPEQVAIILKKLNKKTLTSDWFESIRGYKLLYSNYFMGVMFGKIKILDIEELYVCNDNMVTESLTKCKFDPAYMIPYGKVPMYKEFINGARFIFNSTTKSIGGITALTERYNRLISDWVKTTNLEPGIELQCMCVDDTTHGSLVVVEDIRSGYGVNSFTPLADRIHIVQTKIPFTNFVPALNYEIPQKVTSLEIYTDHKDCLSAYTYKLVLRSLPRFELFARLTLDRNVYKVIIGQWTGFYARKVPKDLDLKKVCEFKSGFFVCGLVCNLINLEIVNYNLDVSSTTVGEVSILHSKMMEEMKCSENNRRNKRGGVQFGAK